MAAYACQDENTVRISGNIDSTTKRKVKTTFGFRGTIGRDAANFHPHALAIAFFWKTSHPHHIGFSTPSLG